MEYAIEVENLYYNHAGENALRGIHLNVPQGSLFGIIGADGAGKSTLFRILSTLLPIQKGQAHIYGYSVSSDLPCIRTLIGYMPQRFSLYSDLTVKENLHFAAEIMGMTGKQKEKHIDKLLQFSRLEEALNRRAAQLSGGMKQKLALCCALVRNPKVLLLDEPTVGVDPVTRKDFWDMLASLKNNGSTIIVSTPYMDEAELCDHVVLLHEGRILGQGTPHVLCLPLQGCLWKITGETHLHVPTSMEPPPPLDKLYTMGGSLHAYCSQPQDAERILSSVKRICPNASSIELAPPKIEDAFLLALHENGNAP